MENPHKTVGVSAIEMLIQATRACEEGGVGTIDYSIDSNQVFRSSWDILVTFLD